MKKITEMTERLAGYDVIVKRWKSDLEFFRFESAFLLRLKDDYYFTRLPDYRNMEALQQAGEHLLELQSDILQASARVDAQLYQLAAIAENRLDENAQQPALTNAAVGHLIISLTHEYQEVKKQLFAAVEKIFRELKPLND